MTLAVERDVKLKISLNLFTQNRILLSQINVLIFASLLNEWIKMFYKLMNPMGIFCKTTWHFIDILALQENQV